MVFYTRTKFNETLLDNTALDEKILICYIVSICNRTVFQLKKKLRIETASSGELHASLYLLTSQQPDTFEYLNLETDLMARKRDFGVTFVNIRLTLADKDAFLSWVNKEKIDIEKALNYCAEKGYKLSCTYDDDNVCWIVSLTGTKHAARNEKFSFSTRGEDVLEAICLAFYKSVVVCEDGDWTDFETDVAWG